MRKYPTTSKGFSYTWSLYDTVTSTDVPTTTFDPTDPANVTLDAATKLSILTIPKNILTGANMYEVRCISNLDFISEDN